MESAKMMCFAFLGLWCLCQATASEDNVVTVTSILSRPYLAIAPENSTSRFEGFVVDLLEKLAEVVGFDYRIKLVADGKYGSKNEDGTWNGMIGELTRMEADMAVAPLTITRMRERVVDFSHPFLMLGLRMLMQKSTASYVTSWEDLANDDNVTAIIIEGGFTQNYFRTSSIALQERIWSKMVSNLESFAGSTDEGVNRVRESPNSVFIESSTSLTYQAERSEPCDLTVVGDYLAMKGYGVATPLGSPYRERINLAVLELREVGEIEKLYKKWFFDRGECQK